uniref:Protein kinase domain-containing protein n=2 Tax=Physcomitrium patens TaxID=3218 RepID=A0A2K1JZV8_PHYPA|nr:hypothetical protein PHYPA_014179 [Physcomitrium patens]
MDFLRASMEITMKASTSLRKEVLNERQCKNLLNNFSRGLDTIQTIIGDSYLFKIVCKIRNLIEECYNEDWLKSVVIQINNKEAFRELLMDLDYCFDTTCSISQLVSKRFKGGELGIIVFLDEYINFEYEISPILLDENEIVNMYGTKWFGIESVIKVIPIFNNFENRLCYMHDMKVAHCDLKLDNIIVNSMNILVVVDLKFIHIEVKNTPQVCIGGNTLETIGCIKILIVLDDVRSDSQLDELLDVDKFKNDDGSKLITASSTWRSLKSYVSKHSKVDMRTVDKAESMELFSMHVFATNEPCLIYLKDITNKIVYACGRLLLSLEVMDIYLHGNQQLIFFLLYKKLKKLPKGFRSLTCLKKLYMWECEALEEFPSRLPNLITLEELNFLNCRNLKKLLEGFGSLIYLKKLFMRDYKALEEFLSRLPNLALEDFLSRLPNLITLEELDFSNCRNLKNLLEGFRSLIYLKELFMRECEALEEFLNRLPNLISLEELIFSHYKKLKKLLKGFRSLTCLKKLYMWDYKALEEIPSGLPNLIALKELDFLNCRNLKKLLEESISLTYLKKLFMMECEALEEFLSRLPNLIALEELIFSCCIKLKKLPKRFRSLICLKKLLMRECEALDEFLSGLPNLALEEFLSGLLNLNSLEELYFVKCRNLKMLLEGFGSLTYLKKLFINECKALEEFPSGLSNLVVLEDLIFLEYKKLKK